MKYITTDKHPFLKEGVCLNKGESFFDYEIQEGWIEEAQEKEFTKRDMIEFVRLYADDPTSSMNYYESEFKRFINNRNNEQKSNT